LREGTVNDTVSYVQMQTLCIEMLGSGIHTAPRDMSMATWSSQTIGRGDDARLVFLPDLITPLGRAARLPPDHCPLAHARWRPAAGKPAGAPRAPPQPRRGGGRLPPHRAHL
jgi:hypothetical protein